MTADGHAARYFVISIFPILDAHGAIGALGLAVVDATERRQIEENLARSEAKFRAFVEQSSEGVVITDEQGHIIEWNRAMEHISGLRREAVLGGTFWNFEVNCRLVTPQPRKSASDLERWWWPL